MFTSSGRMILATQLLKDEAKSIEALELSLLLQRSIFVERLEETVEGTDIHRAVLKAVYLADKLLKLLKGAEGEWGNLDEEETISMHKEYQSSLADMTSSVIEGLFSMMMMDCDCDVCQANKKEQIQYLN